MSAASHTFFAAVLGTLAASVTSELVHGTELQCIGRVAHNVTYTLDGEQFSDVSVLPAPERNNECNRLGNEYGTTRHICMGLNQDETCAAAKAGSKPLPFGTKCQDCFVGMETDLFYKVNISKFRVHNLGVGLQGTQLHSKVHVTDDKGDSPPPKSRSIKFGETPHQWQLKLLGHVLATFKVSMPTELYYEDDIHADVHGDVGADLDVDLGDNYVEYTEGKGLEHHRDKARISVHPVHEVGEEAKGNLKFGLTSNLAVEVVDMMWFHLNLASEVTTQITSTGDSAQQDLVHSCVQGGVSYSAGHEADFHVSILNRTFEKHIGPIVDKQYQNPNITHKCVDIHRKKRDIVVI